MPKFEVRFTRIDTTYFDDYSEGYIGDEVTEYTIIESSHKIGAEVATIVFIRNSPFNIPKEDWERLINYSREMNTASESDDECRYTDGDWWLYVRCVDE